MNATIEMIKIILKDIENQVWSEKEHLGYLTNVIREKLEKYRYVIILGKTPLGCHWAEKLITEDKKVFFYDIKENDAEFSVNGNKVFSIYESELIQYSETATYLISSRERAQEYLAKLNQEMNILSYNEMLLLSERYELPNTLFHSKKAVVEKIKDIFQYPSIYKNMIDAFADKKSALIFAKILLYRLFIDISLASNIKSYDRHYFDKDIIKLNPDEVFVDAGGFNGDTLADFLEVSGGKFKKYYYFEPLKKFYSQVKKQYEYDNRIQCEESGLWSEDRIIGFESGNDDTQGRISQEGNNRIHVIKLDQKKLIPPTMIKMDIEGSELNALEGCKSYITKYMPKLAICIYHKPDDMRKIICWLQSMSYTKLYLRCGENNLDYEIIVYAMKN